VQAVNHAASSAFSFSRSRSSAFIGCGSRPFERSFSPRFVALLVGVLGLVLRAGVVCDLESHFAGRSDDASRTQVYSVGDRLDSSLRCVLGRIVVVKIAALFLMDDNKMFHTDIVADGAPVSRTSSEKGRFEQERSGNGYMTNPYTISSFSVRQDQPGPLVFAFEFRWVPKSSLCYKRFRNTFRLCATNLQERSAPHHQRRAVHGHA
jgi:hypothetical protein